MFQFEGRGDKEFGLGWTHEEVVTPLAKRFIHSYRDLPVAVYHFSTKFRNEPRARSGILRGREFMMKDLYSAHVSETDMLSYYGKVKDAYSKIFKRLGFNFKVVEASGGVFTEKHTHEFQVVNANGEDTFFYCDKCDYALNKEIFEGKVGGICPKCKKGKIKEETGAVEVGNIFPLGTWYAERMRVYYTDEKGLKKPVWFASYGIGPTRVMGTLVEISHDDRGIIWSPQVSPFDVHLIELPGGKGREIHDRLKKEEVDVLWDERNIQAGVKFGDADLIGISIRLITSEKTGDKIEWKERKSDKTELLTFEEVVNKLRK